VGSLRTTLQTLQLDQLNPSIDDKIADWNVDGIEPPIVPDSVYEKVLPDDSDSTISYPDALNFFVNSDPFKKLISSIKTSMVLTPRDGTLMNIISKRIVGELSRLSKKTQYHTRHCNLQACVGSYTISRTNLPRRLKSRFSRCNCHCW